MFRKQFVPVQVQFSLLGRTYHRHFILWKYFVSVSSYQTRLIKQLYYSQKLSLVLFDQELMYCNECLGEGRVSETIFLSPSTIQPTWKKPTTAIWFIRKVSSSKFLALFIAMNAWMKYVLQENNLFQPAHSFSIDVTIRAGSLGTYYYTLRYIGELWNCNCTQDRYSIYKQHNTSPYTMHGKLPYCIMKYEMMTWVQMKLLVSSVKAGSLTKPDLNMILYNTPLYQRPSRTRPSSWRGCSSSSHSQAATGSRTRSRPASRSRDIHIFKLKYWNG